MIFVAGVGGDEVVWLIMSEKASPPIPYSLFGLAWRLVVAGVFVFVLTGAGSYLLAERMIERPEAETPNLLTLKAEDALFEASNAGFSLLVEGEEASELLDNGEILSQRPSPGMRIKQGSCIRVTIASRP